MSIDSDVQVMRAKLAGAKGVPTLMQLAAQGNMSAAIALKDIKDQEDAKAAMMRQAGISNEAPAGSVLSGLAAEIEAQKAPMPTTQGYAEGGRVRAFAGGEGVEDPDAPSWWRASPLAAYGSYRLALPVLEKAAAGIGTSVGELIATAPGIAKEALTKRMPSLPKSAAGKAGVAGALGMTAYDTATTPTEDYRTRFGMETDDPSLGGDLVARGLGAASDLGNTLTFGAASSLFRDKQKARADAPAKAAEAAASVDDRQKRDAKNWAKPAAKSGLAAAVEPTVPDEARVDDREPRPSLQGKAAEKPPSALDAYLANLQKLQDEGKELTAQQQKILDDAHAKAQERNKGGGFWDLMAKLGAQAGTKNGTRALNSLGAGAREYQADEKKRKGEVDKEDLAYQNSSLLLKQADNAAARGDLKGAYDLRNKAAELESKLKHEAAQTREADARAAAQPELARARTTAATRPRGTGVKGVMTPKDWMNHEGKLRAELTKAVNSGLMAPEDFDATLAARMAQDRATYGGGAATIPGNAPAASATTGAKFLGFE